ncbi:MAG TPA: AI-2E family transporter [Vicinamibacterales bacterium]|jgi:predicted PurR-regulated permease PerM|nr:AI-2E family transporter [Vicinamibacterales bacterium]
MAESEPKTNAESSEPEPIEIRSPVNIRSAALTVILVLAVIIILQFAQQVLIPIVLAVLISYMLAPIVTFLTRLYIPRVIGALLAVVLFVTGLGVAVWSVTDDAIRLVEDMPRAARQVRDSIRQQRLGSDDSALQKVEEAATEIEKTAAEATPTARPASDIQRVQVVQPTFRAADYLWWGSMGIIGFAGEATMILFLAYFLTASGDLYKRKLVKIAGDTLSRKKITVQILDEINRQIENFLITLFATSALVAALTAAALWWLGLREWLFWGIVSGVLNTIPYFGPVIVSGALFVVGYLQFGAFIPSFYVAGAAAIITSLEGWLLSPVLMGRAARMNPGAVFVGLLFWSWVWEAWGVILAVPMMMILKAVCDRVEDLKPVAELIGE